MTDERPQIDDRNAADAVEDMVAHVLAPRATYQPSDRVASSFRCVPADRLRAARGRGRGLKRRGRGGGHDRTLAGTRRQRRSGRPRGVGPGFVAAGPRRRRAGARSVAGQLHALAGAR